MNVRFNGGADAPEMIEAFGIVFIRGEWVALEHVPDKLLNNPEFEVAVVIEHEPIPAPPKRGRPARQG